MYFDIVKLQIASACFLFLIVCEYFNYKKLPLLSTKCFTGMLITSIVNLLFDFITAYTILHLDTFNVGLNRALNTMYYMSFIVMIIFLYMYINFFGREQKRENRYVLIAKLIPGIVGSIVLCFCNPKYYYDGNIVYTYGISVQITGIICFIYVCMTYFDLFYHKSLSSKLIKVCIGVFLWSVLMLIEILSSSIVLSALANTILIFIIFSTVENPKMLLDQGVKCFNDRGLKLMIDEIKAHKKDCYFIHIHIDNYENLSSRLGYKNLNRVFYNMLQSYVKAHPYQAFRRTANSFVLIVSVNDKIENSIKRLNEHIGKFDFLLLQYHIDVVSSEAFVNHQGLESILDYENYMFSYKDKREYRFIDEAIEKPIMRKSQIIELLKYAINHDGFDVFYQPIYDAAKEKYTQIEALVRLKDDKRLGYISPEEFIPLAEREGLIGQIGDIVFANVCNFINESKEQISSIDTVSINISAVQCTNLNLFTGMLKQINLNNIDPRKIEFEISEEDLLAGGEKINEVIDELKAIGCNISIDDFGLIYGNILNLTNEKFRTIKIDKSLIWPCFNSDKGLNDKHKVLLQETIAMIKSLGYDIIAEGVETSNQFEMLKEFGVSRHQGYYFSRPMKACDLIEFLNKQKLSV